MQIDVPALIAQIQLALGSPPPERVAEVADVIAFISDRERDRALSKAGSAASVGAFERVWNNPDDGVYHAL
jgi:hypothetical protein